MGLTARKWKYRVCYNIIRDNPINIYNACVYFFNSCSMRTYSALQIAVDYHHHHHQTRERLSSLERTYIFYYLYYWLLSQAYVRNKCIINILI